MESLDGQKNRRMNLKLQKKEKSICDREGTWTRENKSIRIEGMKVRE